MYRYADLLQIHPYLFEHILIVCYVFSINVSAVGLIVSFGIVFNISMECSVRNRVDIRVVICISNKSISFRIVINMGIRIGLGAIVNFYHRIDTCF